MASSIPSWVVYKNNTPSQRQGAAQTPAQAKPSAPIAPKSATSNNMPSWVVYNNGSKSSGLPATDPNRSSARAMPGEGGVTTDQVILNRLSKYDITAGQKRLTEIDAEIEELKKKAARDAHYSGARPFDVKKELDAKLAPLDKEKASIESEIAGAKQVKALAKADGYNVSEGRTRIEELDKQMDDLKKAAAREAHFNSARSREISKELDAKLAPLQQERANLYSEVNTIDKAQKTQKYYELSQDEEFDKYRKKGSTAVSNKRVDNVGKKPGDKGLYSFMETDEQDMYDYLLGKFGEDEADEYFEYLSQELKYRKGMEKAAEIDAIDSDLLQTARADIYGFNAGLSSFAEGALGTITGKEREITARQYGAAQVREDLGKLSDGWMKQTFGSNLAQATFDASTSLGNMAPSILLSYLTAGAAGTLGASAAVAGEIGQAAAGATMFAGVYGNARDEMLRMGYSENSAKTYATLNAAAEVGLEKVLGGFDALGGKLTNEAIKTSIANVDNAFFRYALTMGGKMIGEGTEEYLQDVLDPLFKNIAFSESNKVNILSKEGAYSFLVACMSVIPTESVSTYKNVNNCEWTGAYINAIKDVNPKAYDAFLQEATNSSDKEVKELADSIVSGEYHASNGNLGQLAILMAQNGNTTVENMIRSNADDVLSMAKADIFNSAMSEAEKEYEAIVAANPGMFVMNPIESKLHDLTGWDTKKVKEQAGILTKIFSGIKPTGKELDTLDVENPFVQQIFKEFTGVDVASARNQTEQMAMYLMGVKAADQVKTYQEALKASNEEMLKQREKFVTQRGVDIFNDKYGADIAKAEEDAAKGLDLTVEGVKADIKAKRKGKIPAKKTVENTEGINYNKEDSGDNTRDEFIKDRIAKGDTQEKAEAAWNRFVAENKAFGNVASVKEDSNGREQVRTAAEGRVDDLGERGAVSEDRERGDRPESSSDAGRGKGNRGRRSERAGENESNESETPVTEITEYNEEQTKLVESLKADGFTSVVLVTGPLTNDKDVLVNAKVKGGKITLRWDSPQHKPEVIADHERIHHWLDQFKTDKERADYVQNKLIRIIDNLDDLNTLYKAYKKAYKESYKDLSPEAFRDAVYEEILCDVYAGMDNYGVNAGKYAEAARTDLTKAGLRENALKAFGTNTAETSGQKSAQRSSLDFAESEEYNGRTGERTITVAPYFNTEVNNANYAEVKERADKTFRGAAKDISSQLGFRLTNVHENIGGYSFDDGSDVTEISYTFYADNISEEQALLFTALLCDTGYEVQDSGIASKYVTKDEAARVENASLELSVPIKPQGDDVETIAKSLRAAGIKDFTIDRTEDVIRLFDSYGSTNEEINQTIVNVIDAIGDNYDNEKMPTARYGAAQFLGADDRADIYRSWLETSGVEGRQSGSVLYDRITWALSRAERYAEEPGLVPAEASDQLLPGEPATALAPVDADVIDETGGDITDSYTRFSVADPGWEPEQTKTIIKTCFIDPRYPGELFPAKVAMNGATPFLRNVWEIADTGAIIKDENGNVKLNNQGRIEIVQGGEGTKEKRNNSDNLAWRPAIHGADRAYIDNFLVAKNKVPGGLLPYNIVFVEAEVPAGKNYMLEALEYGANEKGNVIKTAITLPYLPLDGDYMYRTNPSPTAAVWHMSGAMKLTRVLSDAEVRQRMAELGMEIPQREAPPTDQQIADFKSGKKTTPPEGSRSVGGDIDLARWGFDGGVELPVSSSEQVEAKRAWGKRDESVLASIQPGYVRRPFDWNGNTVKAIMEYSGFSDEEIAELKRVYEEEHLPAFEKYGGQLTFENELEMNEQMRERYGSEFEELTGKKFDEETGRYVGGDEAPVERSSVMTEDPAYIDYNRRALVSEDTLEQWLRDYAASNPNYAQAYIAYMSPSQFLKMTTDSIAQRQRIKSQSEEMTETEAQSRARKEPIFLRVDVETGEVQGHEGRHRMVALDRAGITKVPVLFFDSQNKYSKQPIEEATFRGQFTPDLAIVENLQPLSRGNIENVKQMFSEMSSQERMGEKYGGRTTMRFSVASDEDTQTTENTEDTKAEPSFPKGTLEGDVLEMLKNADNPEALQEWVNKILAKAEENKRKANESPVIPKAGTVTKISPEERKIERDQLDALIKKYGAHKEGENPARRVVIPEKVAEGRRVRQFLRTAEEAKGMPERGVEQIDRAILRDEAMSYEPISDKAAMKSAVNAFRDRGYESVRREWEGISAVNNFPTKYDIALGEQLIIEAARMGDDDTLMKVTADVAAMGTQAGQVVQAMRLLKKMSPTGQLYYVQKAVDRLNKQNEGRIMKGTMPAVVINKALAKAVILAENQEQMDKAMDKLLQDIADQLPVTFMDKWNSWRYLSMLGNPRTHIRNLAGNGIFKPVVFAKDLLAATLESTFIKDSDKRTKNAAALMHSKKYADLREFATHDFDEVEPYITGTGKQNPANLIMDKRTIFKKKDGSANALEKLSRLNSNLLEKEDGWFLKPAYVNAMTSYLAARGIDPRRTDPAVQKEIEAARQYATLEAQKSTYRDFSLLANKLNQLKRTPGLVGVLFEGLIPFTKTPINVLRRGFEYSPAGLIKTCLFEAGKLKRGDITAAEFIDHLAAGATGTAVAMLGLVLANLGIARGGDDDDEEKKNQLEATQGHQEYSLEFDFLGEKRSYTVDWTAPVALPFFIGVELQKVLSDDGKLGLMELADAMSLLTEPMLNLSMLDGISSALESASYSQSNKLTAFITNAFVSYVSQGLPTFGGQVARTLDPDRRMNYVDKNSDTPAWMQRFVQNAQGKIIGLENEKTRYYDLWGRTDTNSSMILRGLENFISPGYANTIRETPVDAELLRLYDATKIEAVLPSSIEKYFSVDSQTLNLTADQYEQYAKVRGQTSYNALLELITSEVYGLMEDSEKATAIQKALDYAKQAAKLDIAPTYAATKWIQKANEFDISGAAIQYEALNDILGIKDEELMVNMAWLDDETLGKLNLSKFDNKTTITDASHKKHQFKLDPAMQNRLWELYEEEYWSAYASLIYSSQWATANTAKRAELLNECNKDVAAAARKRLSDELNALGYVSEAK